MDKYGKLRLVAQLDDQTYPAYPSRVSRHLAAVINTVLDRCGPTSGLVC